MLLEFIDLKVVIFFLELDEFSELLLLFLSIGVFEGNPANESIIVRIGAPSVYTQLVCNLVSGSSWPRVTVN